MNMPFGLKNKIQTILTRYLDWVEGLRCPLWLRALRFGVGRFRTYCARLSIARFTTRICECGTVLAAVIEILVFWLLVAMLALSKRVKSSLVDVGFG
jgi:hypothetical protein